MIDFWKYHNEIESAIRQAFGKKRTVKEADFAKVMSGIWIPARKLCKEMLKRHPVERRKQIDDCWLTIFCVSLVTSCWASAVARGKGIDRKRDAAGRIGWLGFDEEKFLDYYKIMNRIGLDVATRKLAEEGDTNTASSMTRLTGILEEHYKPSDKKKGGKRK